MRDKTTWNEQRHLQVYVIGLAAANMIHRKRMEVENVQQPNPESIKRLMFAIMDRLYFEYPTDQISWSLLNQPVIREVLRDSLTTQGFCCLATSRCCRCHDFAHRVIAVFPYLCEIAAFVTDELPERFVSVTIAAKEQSVSETQFAERFIGALKWAWDSGIFRVRACKMCAEKSPIIYVDLNCWDFFGNGK